MPRKPTPLSFIAVKMESTTIPNILGIAASITLVRFALGIIDKGYRPVQPGHVIRCFYT